MTQVARVIKPYQAQYTDPIHGKRGDVLQTDGRTDVWQGNPEHLWCWCQHPDGREGWVPQTLLQATTDGLQLTADYAATELSAADGEFVTALHFNSGWYWCKRDQALGWLPADHLSIRD
jgi:hypothetical protein